MKSLQPEEISTGRKFVNHIGKEIVSPAATAAGKKLLTGLLNKGVEKILSTSLKDLEGAKKPVENATKKTVDNVKKAVDKEATKQAKKEAKAAEKQAKKTESSDDTVYYSGTVSWPDYRKSTSSQRKSGKDYVDAEWSEVKVSDARSSSYTDAGQRYIAGYLPSPKDDDR